MNSDRIIPLIPIVLGVAAIVFCIGYLIWDFGSAERKIKKELLYQRQQLMAQQIMAQQIPWINTGTTSIKKNLDPYERTQLALIQLQTLFLAGELEKQELLNATRMTLSLDRENLTIVEEIIKSKLG